MKIQSLLNWRSGWEKIGWFHRSVLLLISASFILRIPILFLRWFCPDELQHLHATWSIAHGMVPYRDFFEHHTPFIHYFLLPAYAIFRDTIVTLFVSRGIMLPFAVGIIYLVYRLGKMAYGTNAGLIGALFAAYNMMLLDKTIEIRPDLPGIFFWLLTLIFLMAGLKSKRRVHYALSGAMMASGILCTQKLLFGAAGLFVSVVWFLFDRRTGNTMKESAKAVPWMLLGFAVPFAIACAYFAANHALDDFVYRNFIMNTRWRHRTTWWEVKNYFILYNVRQNPFFTVFSITGLVIATYRLRSRRDASRGAFVPIIATYVLMAGIFVIPEAYPQYFSLFLVLLSVFGGLAASTMMPPPSLEELRRGLRDRKTDFVVYGLIGLSFLYSLTRVLVYSKPSIPFLSEVGPSLCSWPAVEQVPHSTLGYAAVWVVILLGIALALLRIRRGAGAPESRPRVIALLVLIGIIAYPVAQMISQWKRTNTEMLQEIRFVLDNTTKDDYVIDGFHGPGVFRPHVYYYHFVHIGVRMMLTEKELSADIVSLMQEKRPRIVVYDQAFEATSEAVRQYVHEHYKPTGVGYLYILKARTNQTDPDTGNPGLSKKNYRGELQRSGSSIHWTNVYVDEEYARMFSLDRTGWIDHRIGPLSAGPHNVALGDDRAYSNRACDVLTICDGPSTKDDDVSVGAGEYVNAPGAASYPAMESASVRP